MKDFWFPDKEYMEFMQRTSSEMMKQKRKRERIAFLKQWLADKLIDILALIVAIIALIRTF